MRCADAPPGRADPGAGRCADAVAYVGPDWSRLPLLELPEGIELTAWPGCPACGRMLFGEPLDPDGFGDEVLRDGDVATCRPCGIAWAVRFGEASTWVPAGRPVHSL